MDNKTYLQNGQLQLAISSMNNAVKMEPQNINKRSLLWELLCIAGEFDRAEKQLDIIAEQEPAASVTAAVFRQLIRAERIRQQCFLGKQKPEFIGEATADQQLVLQALTKLQEGDVQQAQVFLQQAENLRPPLNGSCNGETFQGIRDCDDICAGFFEVLTSQGHYYWVPIATVVSMEFTAPQHPIDLIWRRAHLTVHAGPEGEVYIPATYSLTPLDDEQARLGYKTEWQIENEQLLRGIGQRLFLVGNQDIPIMAMQNLTIERTGAV